MAKKNKKAEKEEKQKKELKLSKKEADSEKNPDEATKMSGKEYNKELIKLQRELCVMQEWVKATGQKVVVVFEGRDAAGKGGTIKALTERVSPRVFRVVALPVPTEREKTQIYIQRYMHHFPAAGEVVIFDRSWYNRAGVEYVMGFCTKEQHTDFLEVCPSVESFMVNSGIKVVKYWLEVSNEEQARRFEARIDDPLRQWKLSATDLPSRERWYDYSRARDMMLDATDTVWAPWHIVNSDNKKKARLNLLKHFLSLFPYEEEPRPKIKLPKADRKHSYDDEATMRKRKWIADSY